jgi:thiamine biosynthesis lipoprotein
MGTTVSIRIVSAERTAAEQRAHEAFAWFEHVERTCSRFDPSSELARLSESPWRAHRVSPLLLELLTFALAVAEASDGAFDPTVGATLMARGSDRAWRTGTRLRTDPAPAANATWRDVHIDASTSTVRLLRPLCLDLGAVAKGFAVDLAARALTDCRDFALDAGGDLYVSGTNAAAEAWTVGIADPHCPDGPPLMSVAVRDRAVCTSGNYRRVLDDGAGHLHDPRASAPATAVASTTVIAPSAMVADALATAAFVLGAPHGVALWESHGVAGLMVAHDGTQLTTHDWPRYAHAAQRLAS